MIKLIIILVFSLLEVGCANYPASNNYGMYPNLSTNFNGILPANSRRYTANARNTFREMDRQAKRQAFEERRRERAELREDQRRQAAEFKEQRRAERKAAMVEWQQKEIQPRASLTPAQRKAEDEARERKPALALGIIGTIIAGGGGGGGSTSTCPDGSTPSGGMCSRRDNPISAPEPAPAPTPYYKGAVGVYSTGQGFIALVILLSFFEVGVYNEIVG